MGSLKVINNKPKRIEFEAWTPNEAQQLCCRHHTKSYIIWELHSYQEEARKHFGLKLDV